MSGNLHRNYTAADIEKYWKGQLSPSEMHALEKAAMDDPFLADALEGYRNAPTATADVAALHKTLAQRVTPVRKMQWTRIAASVILIAGIGYATYMLSTKDATTPVTQAEQQQNIAIRKDSTPPNNADQERAPDVARTVDTIRTSIPTTARVTNTDTPSTQSTSETFFNIDRDQAKVTEDIQARKEPTTAPPVATYRVDSIEAFSDKEQVAANKASQGMVDKKGKKLDGYAGLINNKFFGRVVDANNQPIPFANVTNTRDNVGTYTNMNGDFNLISADSSLDLRIKSVGYEPRNFRFQPTQNKAVIAMSDDPFTRDDVAKQPISRLKLTPRQQLDSLEEEETEEIAPEVGWTYYNRYIANNIKLPSNKGSYSGNDVELSFQVDKYGSPTNIKITRSSKCKECDQAAIQVLKDGPKWKRTTKRSRTSVTISVEQ